MPKEYTVLVVEDDKKLRSTVEDYLFVNGFNVLTAENGYTALEIFFLKNSEIDLILLDGMLPDIDGFDVLKRIRKESNVPIIMLSAREAEHHQLQGFRMGADNYITKPFLLSVLKEHVLALLNRTSPKDDCIVKGALKVYPGLRKILVNNVEVETTPREYETLVFLIENEKRVLDRNQILDAVWGMDYYGDTRTVDTIIKQLRKKLTADYPYIKSVYGIGYYFEVSHV